MQHLPPIHWLSAPGTPDPALLGGKAHRLALLARRGLPVPDGFVLGPGAFRQSLARLGIREIGDRAEECVAALRRVPLAPELEAALADALRRLGGGPVAVRSSALDEDAADRSFAGQYRSYLGLVELQEVVDAIRETWASAFDQRVQAYRDASARGAGARRPLPSLGAGGMAVLVQRMVDARTSGILFTANPLSGSTREMTLEAGPGLGDELAAGTVHPDLWVLARTPRAPHGEAPSCRDHTPAPGRSQPLLAEQEVVALGRLGLRAEVLLGGPQDVEWSLDREGAAWLLQARPITTLRGALDATRTSEALWTQRFSGERWNAQASTLGWSVMQPVLHHFIEWEDATERFLGGAPPTMLYHGVPYFNIGIFRHLVFRLPGMAPIQFMLEFFPPEEQEVLRRKRVYLPNLGLMGSIFGQVFRERRWRRYRFNFLTNHQVWEEFLPGFVREMETVDAAFDDLDAGLAQVQHARELIVRYVSIHLLSLLFANVFYQLLGAALEGWAGDRDHQLRAALTAAPAENRTVAGHKAMWKLAGLAQQLPQVNDALLDGDAAPSRAELQALPEGERFVRALDEFLVEFGHRSSASWEIFAARWSEDPAVVMAMIASYLRGGIHTDPYLNEERHQQAFRQAREQLAAQLRHTRGQRWLPWRRLLVEQLLDLTRNYMGLRENQRFYFDHLLFRTKRVFLRIGELLCEAGDLDDPGDVSFLEVEELQRLCRGELDRADARAAIEARRRQTAADRDADHPEFLEGGAPLPSDLEHRRTLSGMGISPGKVTGAVRILRHPGEVRKLHRGDILVARATDPGWTPLFLTAGGLIMELGSMLSHGAVVAREYALPAVVNVANATRRLRDGQEVTVDGARGLVYIL